MDPLAHTLVGAALAESGLKRLTHGATAALLIGVNLPDVDVVAHLLSDDASLWYRRGWTHGLLAMAVWPPLLTWALYGYLRRRPSGAGPPLRPKVLFGLALLAVLSHPLLDFLNTYGVRLLMPFDDRWFYGDTLFIMDPWFWLLAGAGVVVAAGRGKLALAYAVLGAGLTFLVLRTELTGLWIKLGWLAGVGLIVTLYFRRAAGASVARLGLAGLTLYIGAMYGLARAAEQRVVAAERAHWVQTNPLPGNLFERRLIAVHADHYLLKNHDGKQRALPRHPAPPEVVALLSQPEHRGFANWLRLPYWQVTTTANGQLVEVYDLRYATPGERNFGIGYLAEELPR